MSTFYVKLLRFWLTKYNHKLHAVALNAIICIRRLHIAILIVFYPCSCCHANTKWSDLWPNTCFGPAFWIWSPVCGGVSQSEFNFNICNGWHRLKSCNCSLKDLKYKVGIKNPSFKIGAWPGIWGENYTRYIIMLALGGTCQRAVATLPVGRDSACRICTFCLILFWTC